MTPRCDGGHAPAVSAAKCDIPSSGRLFFFFFVCFLFNDAFAKALKVNVNRQQELAQNLSPVLPTERLKVGSDLDLESQSDDPDDSSIISLFRICFPRRLSAGRGGFDLTTSLRRSGSSSSSHSHKGAR